VVTPEGTARRVGGEPVLGNAEWVEPAGGFGEGDLVVVAGQAGLKDGVKVRVPEEEPAAAGSGERRTRPPRGRPGARGRRARRPVPATPRPTPTARAEEAGR